MKHIHLVGIGGVGMSAIATLLIKEGFTVSGSDVKENQIIRGLKQAGANVFIGHDKKNVVQTVDTLVYSSAIRQDNPELVEAANRRLDIFRRAQMLYRLMQGKKTITVTGAHGKTTTASLIAFILYQAGLKPTAAIGGLIRNFAINAWLGEGDYFVAEADESDGSFLNYRPKFSVITNIDKEHLDYYGNFKELLNAFSKFMERLEDSGLLIVNSSDNNLLKLAKKSGKRFITFGFDRRADIRAEDIKILATGSEFNCFLKGEKLGSVICPLLGEHNILNCLAAIMLALELNIDFKIIKEAIRGFQGTKRRQEIKLDKPNLLVFDDYAHHPTEIMATLKAIKDSSVSPQRKKIIAVFQPHRYSRTKLLLREFSRAFAAVDHLIIMDIYAASEEPIKGIDAQLLYRKIKKIKKNGVYYLSRPEIVQHILNNLSGNDVVVFLGAGDITKLSDEFSERAKGI
jgi:UDP-N-acetylmuramate--alanine ligase